MVQDVASDKDQSGVNDRDYVKELRALLTDNNSPFVVMEFKGSDSDKVGLMLAGDSESLRPDKIFWNHVPDVVNKAVGEPLFTSHTGDTNMTGEPSGLGFAGTIAAMLSPPAAMALAAAGPERDFEYMELVVAKADLPKLLDNPNLEEIEKILASPYSETAQRTEGFTGAKLKAAALLLDGQEKDTGRGGR